MTPRQAAIAFNLMEEVGPIRVRAMAEVCGSAEAVFEAGAEDLAAARGIGPEMAGRIAARCRDADPDAEEARARARGIRILTAGDPEWPTALDALYDPPLALYVKGALEPRDRHALALVGSRRATHYGMKTADRLAYQVAMTGFTVVSGLARGIDTAAHEGALKADGRTLAVLGGAIDRLYPPEAEPLAERIAQRGALLSEFALGREPDRTTFPYRNRIIAGLTMGTVVIEAGRRSGALMTADSAMEQGKPVFAVPGRIDNPSAAGPHGLIKQGARLVDRVEDILEEFEYLVKVPAEAPPRERDGPMPTLSEVERTVVLALCEGSLHVDELVRRSGQTSAGVSGLLLGLEMKRIIRMLPGRTVELAVDVTGWADSGEAGEPTESGRAHG